MKVDQLKEKLNQSLYTQDYKHVFSLVESEKDDIVESNRLCYFYYICQLCRENYEAEGKLGLLAGKRTVDEAVDALLVLKREVQRVAYCDEYGSQDLPRIMKQVGANANDLLWLAQTSTMNPQDVLVRLRKWDAKKSTLVRTYQPKHRYDGVQIAFILCSNSKQELNETLFYLGRLNVPDGVTIDVMSIEEADSICSAYNEGMKASEAKYKVYLHHDVRIIEKDFIPRIIDVFMDREEVGLIGMVGTKEFPPDGIMWHLNRYGSVIETHVHETVDLRQYIKKEPIEAVLCDGLLMATQYDIPWREDIFDGWDFYDASQCMEFRRAGYKVMIPYQESSWCVHDCGFVNLKDYDKHREIFLTEYGKDTVGMTVG